MLPVSGSFLKGCTVLVTKKLNLFERRLCRKCGIRLLFRIIILIGGSQTQSLLTVGKCKDSFCMHVDRAASGPVLETYAGFAGKWLVSVTTIMSQTIRPSNGGV